MKITTDDIQETLLDRAADKLANTKLRVEHQESQNKRLKKSRILLFTIITVMVNSVALTNYLYSTNNQLKEEAQVLKVESSPSYQHVNTITYPDPVCRDDLIVTLNGHPVCGDI